MDPHLGDPGGHQVLVGRAGARVLAGGLDPPAPARGPRRTSRAQRGFTKQVLYLDASVVGDDLVGHAVDRPSTPDRALQQTVGALHRSLAQPTLPLVAELLVVDVGERLRRTLRPLDPDPAATDADPGRAAELAEAARAELDANLVERITMHEVAALLHASPGHVARSFTATFGIAPHAYVLGRRIGMARDLLLDGWPPSEVAAVVGFVDEAHLSRHFRRHVGTTPGRFAAGRQRLKVTHD